MADNRPLWFSSFVLVVLFLGFIAGYRVARQVKPILDGFRRVRSTH